MSFLLSHNLVFHLFLTKGGFNRACKRNNIIRAGCTTISSQSEQTKNSSTKTFLLEKDGRCFHLYILILMYTVTFSQELALFNAAAKYKWDKILNIAFNLCPFLFQYKSSLLQRGGVPASPVSCETQHTGTL